MSAEVIFFFPISAVVSCGGAGCLVSCGSEGVDSLDSWEVLSEGEEESGCVSLFSWAFLFSDPPMPKSISSTSVEVVGGGNSSAHACPMGGNVSADATKSAASERRVFAVPATDASRTIRLKRPLCALCKA